MPHTARALALLALTQLIGCPAPGPDDDDDGLDDAGPDAREVVAVGGLTVEQDDDGAVATAHFSADVPVESGCAVDIEIGGCTLFTCDPASAPVAPSPSLDAGALHVTGGDDDVTLTFADQGYAPVTLPGASVLDNGITLIASAAGGADMGAFEVQVAAPTPLRMSDPALSSVSVKVTEALPLAWTGTSIGALRVRLVESPVARHVATCTVDAGALAFSIPPEVIGRFPVGDGDLEIVGATVATVNVDDAYAVSFTALTPATSAVGAAARYNVFFTAP